MTGPSWHTRTAIAVIAVASSLAVAPTVPTAVDADAALPDLPIGIPYGALFSAPLDTRGAAVKLAGCYVTFLGIPTTEAHARRYVPRGYELAGLGSATGGVAARLEALVDGDPDALGEGALLGVWNLACDRTAVGRARPTPARLSLAGVSIAPRPADVVADPFKQTGAANVASFYLFKVQTSSRRLASALARRGLPAKRVRRFAYRSTAAHDTATVTSRSTGYKLTVNAQFDDVVFGPHDHDNQFWYRTGRSAVDLRLRLHDARDSDCVFRGADLGCQGTIKTRSQNRMAAFLGTTHHVSLGVALRHHKVPTGALTIERPSVPRDQP
jgi:hypothetical protein